MTDKQTVDLIDEILAWSPKEDAREVALDLLKAGAAIGKLDEAVGVVCRRYNLRPLALVEWFTAKMEVLAEETKKQVEAVRTWEKQKT